MRYLLYFGILLGALACRSNGTSVPIRVVDSSTTESSNLTPSEALALVEAKKKSQWKKARAKLTEKEKNKRDLALFYAFSKGAGATGSETANEQLKKVRSLLKQGADPESVHTDSRETALMNAAQLQRPKILEAMFDVMDQFEIDRTDKNGQTALFKAVNWGTDLSDSLELVTLLLKKGATLRAWAQLPEGTDGKGEGSARNLVKKKLEERFTVGVGGPQPDKIQHPKLRKIMFRALDEQLPEGL